MRAVKQRLLEMVPDLRIFLDVDDLEEIGNLSTIEAPAEVTDILNAYLARLGT